MSQCEKPTCVAESYQALIFKTGVAETLKCANGVQTMLSEFFYSGFQLGIWNIVLHRAIEIEENEKIYTLAIQVISF